MEINLENVHVVIYSKKMLKEAIKRLTKHGKKIETDIMCDYEFHGNDLLIYHDGIFRVIHDLPTHPNHEITLNYLCEIIINQESIRKELEACKWYKSEYGSIICYTGDLYNSYGVTCTGNWYTSGWTMTNSSLTEATHKEIEQVLIKEAKKRGFKDEFIAYNSTNNSLHGDDERTILDSKGNWAETIEVDKLNIGEWAMADDDGYLFFGKVTEVGKLTVRINDRGFNTLLNPVRRVTLQDLDNIREDILS